VKLSFTIGPLPEEYYTELPLLYRISYDISWTNGKQELVPVSGNRYQQQLRMILIPFRSFSSILMFGIPRFLLPASQPKD
jgi:hypothetical protein